MHLQRQFESRHGAGISFRALGLALAISQFSALGAEPASGRKNPLPEGRVRTGLAEPGVTQAPVSPATKRNVELENTIRSALPFASEAQRLGVTVTEAEVAGRLELYRKLYPNQALDASRTTRLLLAEKYLEAKGLGVGGRDPDGLVVKKVDPSLYATREEAEMAEKAARLEALLGREEMNQEGRKLEDLAQIKRTSERVPTPLWPLEDIQLEGDPKECLAWQNNDCFVSLGEFNAAAVQFRMQTKMPLDSAKAWILKRYLLDKQVATKAAALGVDRNPDSLLQSQKRMLDGNRWIQSAMAYGMPVQDLRTLQSLYGRHYQEYFAAGDDATLDIIGSSDSAYLDSLHKVLSAWSKRRGAKPVSTKEAAKEPEPDLPWISFREKDLPRELAAVTDSFHVGQFSMPFRSRMGFFMVRLSKLVRRGEVSFDDAVPRLIFHATRNKFLNMDSVLEAQARKYYQENKARFALPDTLELVAWLLPRDWAQSHPRKGPKTAPASRPDTARFKPMVLSSLVLPKETRMLLQSQARADSQKTCFGPLSDPFGRWHFRIRSKKPARDTLPFRLVRKEILEIISSPLPEQPSGLASDESLDEVLLTLGTALAVRRKENKRPGAPGENGGGNVVRGQDAAPDGAPGTGNLHTPEQAKAYLQAQRDKKRIEEEEALRMTRIDYSRLAD